MGEIGRGFGIFILQTRYNSKNSFYYFGVVLPAMDTFTQVCPLMSAGKDVDTLCVGEQCAWYVAPVRKCALYVLGHKTAVDLQQIQKQSRT